MLAALKDSNAGVREQAVIALQNVDGDPTILGALAPLLKDGNSSLRYNVLHALARQGPAALPYLGATLKDKELGVRQQALWAIANVQGDSAKVLAVVVQALKDEDPGVRHSAVQTLARFGAPAIPHLLKALQDDNESVGQMAMYTFANLGAERAKAIPGLVELATKGTSAKGRVFAVYALRQMGPEGLPPLLAVWKEQKDERTRLAVLESLGQLGPAKPGKCSRPCSPP